MISLPIEKNTLNGEPQETINAAQLHQLLNVETPLHIWLPRRIETYGFVEGVEFCTDLFKTNNLLGGRPKKEYFLSLRMAQHLALIENTSISSKIRDALIETERQLREDVPALVRQLKQQNQRLRLFVCSAIPHYNDLRRYFAAGLTQKEMGLLLGVSDTEVRRRLNQMGQLDLISYQPAPRLAAQGRLGKAAQQRAQAQ